MATNLNLGRATGKVNKSILGSQGRVRGRAKGNALLKAGVKGTMQHKNVNHFAQTVSGSKARGAKLETQFDPPIQIP